MTDYTNARIEALENEVVNLKETLAVSTMALLELIVNEHPSVEFGHGLGDFPQSGEAEIETDQCLIRYDLYVTTEYVNDSEGDSSIPNGTRDLSGDVLKDVEVWVKEVFIGEGYAITLDESDRKKIEELIELRYLKG